MLVSFEKWHGARNDFLVIWTSKIQSSYLVDSLRRQSNRLCRKDGAGIGADGIIVCSHDPGRPAFPEEAIIINSDGSLAANCGNGLRCAAMSTRLRNDSLNQNDDNSLSIRVASQEYWFDYLDSSRIEDPCAIMTVDCLKMGEEVQRFSETRNVVSEIASSLKSVKISLDSWSLCEVGNAHLVLFIDSPPTNDCLLLAGQFSSAPPFSDGINIHLAHAKAAREDTREQTRRVWNADTEEQIEVLVWERGVGPTPACGSGACAIAAAYLDTGFCSRQSWVPIVMPGGSLYVRQTDQDGPLQLAGPAAQVFTGQIDL